MIWALLLVSLVAGCQSEPRPASVELPTDTLSQSTPPLPATGTAASDGEAAPPPRDTTFAALERAFAAAVEAKDIGALVAIDRQVAALVRRLNQEFYAAVMSSDTVTRSFEAMSGPLDVQRNGFDSSEGYYDGHVLRVAHALNPHSAWRSHTLWTEVFGEDSFGPPDLVAVRRYLIEFPSGPFAAAAATEAGTLYHDLLVTLRDTRGSGSFCVDHLITKAPRAVQVALARDSALKYLDLALRLEPAGGRAAEARRRIVEGAEPGTRYHCPD